MIIRVGKLMLALVLLIACAMEGVRMWRHTKEAAGVVIAMAMFLGLCWLLVRSALKERPPGKKPSVGWQVFWGIVGGLSFLSILGNALNVFLS